jgi:hypothetical protein
MKGTYSRFWMSTSAELRRNACTAAGSNATCRNLGCTGWGWSAKKAELLGPSGALGRMAFIGAPLV